MAFTPSFKIIPISDPSGLSFEDDSTTDETLISASITLTKPDLSSVVYPFISLGVTLVLIGILDKDYALEATYTAVTNIDTYTKSFRFITLGYIQKAKTARIKRYQLDETIEDKEQYRNNTLKINYYIVVANDRVVFRDLVGGQKALDFIGDIILRDANSPFSY